MMYGKLAHTRRTRLSFVSYFALLFGVIHVMIHDPVASAYGLIYIGTIRTA